MTDVPTTEVPARPAPAANVPTTNVPTTNVPTTNVPTTNVVVLIGRLARPAEARELPSGDRLVAYEVTVDRPGERAETVPVVWLAAPASAADHDVDARVVVIGRVRRRFFRTGSGTQSRTEVVAEAVVNARHAKRAAAALERAQARLAAARP